MPGMVAALTHAIRATAAAEAQRHGDRQVAQLLDRCVADQAISFCRITVWASPRSSPTELNHA